MESRKFYFTLPLLFLILNVQGQADLPAGVSASWYSGTTAGIQKVEYSFYPSGEPKLFRAANTNNHLGFHIHSAGYEVSNLLQKKEEQQWNVSFLINTIGRKTSKHFVTGDFAITNNPSLLTYQSASLDVQYVNDMRGLRQNFIVKERPAGEGQLYANIQVQSSLIADETGKNKIVFHTCSNNKDIKLIYDELKVWDAANTILSASMKLDAATNIISIIVDDHNAVYPITIDPLNRTPEWATSADGILPGLLNSLSLQAQSLYGYTVASLGDVNGDGYDDVAVSAPAMADVITGTGSLTGVGAVFIYLGSPAGLSSSPAKILQPTTALNGALFGFSIDAGDITGDGKNDIVIGAPLDKYQTSASGLFGPSAVEVTAGKVYVYRSEDLFSTANPSPFLQIRLQGTGFFSNGILSILQSNVSIKALFGFSVAVVKDLNGDSKADLVVGAPSYLGVDLLSAQSGAAFVYYSNNLATTSPAQLNTPTPSLLGLAGLPVAGTDGLLFGFSIDDAGDYNNDGKPDLVVSAPAGIDVSSFGGIFTGQVLGGSAYVFYGNGAGVNTTSTVRLQASPTGLLSNTANLFGYKVKGATNAFGSKTGNILIGCPNGAVISNVLGGLKVKAGEVHIFKKKTPAASGSFTSDQVLSSPRSSSILTTLSGLNINVSLLYGASIDNMLDVNCDNVGDLIVGEPLSTAVSLVGTDVVGGASYVYLGNPDGTYNTTPAWDLYTQISPLAGTNTTSLLGFSVAGARHISGLSQGVRSLVGGPSNTLDFGIGLLNLNNTVKTTFDFAADNNGLGKAYSFSSNMNCTGTLPAVLINFQAQAVIKAVALNWTSVTEDNLNLYELERSTDGIHFETIAIAFAKGSQLNDYEYADKFPYMGINYYRLKMVDRDKKYTYSKIIAIHFNQELRGDIIIAPNPVQNDINIKMTGIQKGVYRLKLQNATGQTILTRSITISLFAQTETLQCSSTIISGAYWLNIYDSNNRLVKSIKVLVDRK